MSDTTGIRAGRAYVELALHNSAFMKGLAQAKKHLQDFGNGIALIGKTMMAAGTAVLAPLVAMTAKFESTGSALNDMSQRTGASVELLSGLGYAAKQTGAEMADVEMAFRRTQKTIGDAAKGEKAGVDALKALGLSYSQLKGLSPDKQFELVAQSLAKIKDPTMQAAASMEVFGKSGTSLIPLINDMDALMKRAKELGVVMSGKDASAADELGDAIGDLKSVVFAASNTLIAPFVPVIKEAIQTIISAIDATKKWIQHNQQLILTLIDIAAKTTIAGGGIYGLGKVLTLVGSAISVLSRAYGFLLTQGVALTAGMTLVAAGLGAVAAAFINAKAQGISFGESVLDLTHKLTGLDNAYSTWKANQAASKAIGAPTKTLEKGIQTADPKQMQNAIDQMQSNRDRIAADIDRLRNMKHPGFFSSISAMSKYANRDEEIAALETQLRQAELLLKRSKELQEINLKRMNVNAPIRAIPKILESAKAGEKAGIDFAKSFMDAATPRLAFLGDAMRDLLKLKAENILNSQKREETLANIEYDAKRADISDKIGQGKLDRSALAANETLRQQTLANIREKYARETADRERQLNDETAALRLEGNKRGLAKELELLRIRQKAEMDAAVKRGDDPLALGALQHKQDWEQIALRRTADQNNLDDAERLKIEATMTGLKRDLALLDLKQSKELADAKAAGLNLQQLMQKQGLEKQAFMLGRMPGTTSGTFSATAVQGMGGGNPIEDIRRIAREALVEFRKRRREGEPDFRKLMRALEAKR